MVSPGSPLVTIDVGNSRIKFGFFDSKTAAAGELPRCSRAAAVAIGAQIPWAEIAEWCGDVAVPALLAGANPRGVASVLETWPAALGPLPRVLENRLDLPLTTTVDQPHRVGIDRLLNAVAANAIRAAGHGAVIVDTGTATTVDVVTADGAFAGGAILPGFELSARALHHYTALLPLLSIEELAGEPHDPLGTDTRAAIRSGLFWGQVGAVKELVAQLSMLFTSDRATGGQAGSEPLLLLTGGGAALLAPELPEARFEPHLALQGIVLSSAAAAIRDG